MAPFLHLFVWISEQCTATRCKRTIPDTQVPTYTSRVMSSTVGKSWPSDLCRLLVLVQRHPSISIQT